ncbi:hypothetical protein [Corynebacterium tuberculostearicum]|uniref:hypothetical protein n=1 Tax=Corynebacterium tuberculostearicum TaxID=38304 RepID=UPI00195DAE1C|nr:hypothetical protein [Corynebacterium tuberculostearicum]QRQ67849.1 hypothetical protein I6J28_03850 [Corynebacterium tuberculostearicum]
METEKGTPDKLLSHTSGRYEIANGMLAVVAAILVLVIASAGMLHWGWQGWVLIAVCFVDALIFISRTFWMQWAREQGMKLTDDRGDYVLERTTGFGWAVFLILGIVATALGSPIYENPDNPVVGWLMVLILWTPIPSVVGSSMGKLKAYKDGGESVAWPFKGGKAWFERLANKIDEIGSTTNPFRKNDAQPKRFRKKILGWGQKVRRCADRNAVRWGNVSLVLIQGGSFAAFQIVSVNDDAKAATLFSLPLVGIGLLGLLLTVELSGAIIVFYGMSIFLLAGVLIGIPVERLPFLIAAQFISLTVAAWVSAHIKTSRGNVDEKK